MSQSVSSQPVIEVNHLSKAVTDSTGTLEILRDIHFSLQPQETAAIVGASGSGKSTLLSMLAQYLHFMTVCSSYGALLLIILPYLYVQCHKRIDISKFF